MLVYMIFREKSNIFKSKFKFCPEKSLKKWLTFDRKYNIINNAIRIRWFCGHGGMADALGSGPSARKGMEVQVLLTAPTDDSSDFFCHEKKVRAVFLWKKSIPFALKYDPGIKKLDRGFLYCIIYSKAIRLRMIKQVIALQEGK